DGFVVNTILKEADLFCPNSVRINFTIYLENTLRNTSFYFSIQIFSHNLQVMFNRKLFYCPQARIRTSFSNSFEFIQSR
ncbi:hypothetical protein EFS06_05540, partial [Levilactobacillus brevis]|nr:hypothetical protein [Levilactobacillus brevis]